jgi:hypothetical protein
MSMVLTFTLVVSLLFACSPLLRCPAGFVRVQEPGNHPGQFPISLRRDRLMGQQDVGDDTTGAAEGG